MDLTELFYSISSPLRLGDEWILDEIEALKGEDEAGGESSGIGGGRWGGVDWIGVGLNVGEYGSAVFG